MTVGQKPTTILICMSGSLSIRLIVSIALGLLVPPSVCAEVSALEFESKQSVRVSYKYLIRTPQPSSQKPPLVIYLHGAGERGDDLSKVRALSSPLKWAEEHPDTPFVVAAPLCPGGSYWKPHEVIAFTHFIIEKYKVDVSRVYLTGHSMGGWGTWATAMDYPGVFAAIAPASGRVVPLMSGNLWRTPVWAFHGTADEVVPFSQSKEMIDILKGYENPNVKFSALEGKGHEIQAEVYMKPDLYKWLMEQSLTKVGG